MPGICIVTDSGARFGNPRIIQQYPIRVLPYSIVVAGNSYKEDVDLKTDEALRLMKSQPSVLQLVAPSVEDFVQLYSRLSHHYDAIVSIHTSRELTQSWDHARRAALQVKESADVAVVDSQSICGGQGMLVRLAGQLIAEGKAFETIVKQVRGAVERIYAMYYVESLENLHRSGIMSASRSILGDMLGIKALVNIEDGRLVVTEKVRTRSQAIDRMVEFISEFDELDDALILQNRSTITEQARSLQDRLSQEFSSRHFPYVMYGASLGVFLGANVTGVVVLEQQAEEVDDED